MVRTEEEIKKRIDEVKQRLALLNDAAGRELKRPFFERNRYIFQFVDSERRIYNAILRELQSVINE